MAAAPPASDIRVGAGARTQSADRGQATPLMLLMLVATVGLAVVIAEVGDVLDESARARTAADAAALAGAAEGEAAAAELAIANGGTMEFYGEEFYGEQDVGGDGAATTVTVRVRVGRASQTARAVALVEWVTSDREQWEVP